MRGPDLTPAPSLLPYAASVHAAWLAAEPDVAWRWVDATLVFADVSGFTPLTERLAKRGKIGAEELTDILNSVFGRLLSVAAERGGDCLKFGGDAVLLMFRGPDHPARAVEAANAMLEELRPYKRLKTEAGTVTLGMSVGVHTGRPLLVLAGDSHRELIVLGPDVTATLEAEAAAGSGEVLVSERSTASGTAPPVQSTARDAARAAERAVPAVLRDHLTGEVHEGEHRVAAIGFVQFTGTDDLLAATSAGELGAAVIELVNTVQHACAEHGVTFISSDVDKNAGKIILAAGVPSASSDDELRLVGTLRAIMDANTRLAVRAGVARGRIFAVDLGSAERRAFTVMGDAVNLAARIMGHAPWRHVWAAADVGEKVADRFTLEPLEPFAVKGKAQPVHAVEVGRAIDSADVDSTVFTRRLVGRVRELEQIERLLPGVTESSGAVVELIGEAGIGKSTLRGAAIEGARRFGCVVWSLEAGRYSKMTPFFPLRGPLRAALQLAGDADADAVLQRLESAVLPSAPELGPWLPLLGPAFGVRIADTPETDRLDSGLRPAKTRATVAALVRALLPGPSIVVVEDGHWFDSATSEVLAELATQIDELPWLMLVTRRPDPGGFVIPDDVPLLRLPLEPLDEAEAVELLRRELASVPDAPVLPPGEIERLAARGEGNPLFLLELARAAASGLDELPDTVEAVVATMIDRLPSHDRDLVRCAAILGSKCPPPILAELLHVDDAQLSRRLADLTHFIHQDGDLLRFRHVLLRDVAYEGLPYRRRRALHAEAGAILERSAGRKADDLAELLSTHFHMAHRFAESWRYSRLAGERSERTAAPLEAAVFYERALEAARHCSGATPTKRADVATHLGDVRALSGRYAEARTAYKTARQFASSDPMLVADLYRRAGVSWAEEGRFPEAMRNHQRGRAVLAGVPDAPNVAVLQAQISVAYSGALLRQGRHLEARAVLEEAAARIAKKSGRAAKATLAHSYRLLDWIDVELGVTREVPYRDRSLVLYEEIDDDYGRANVLNNMAIAAYYKGDWNQSVELYGRSLDAARSAGALVFQALVLNNLAEVRSDQGYLLDAESMLRDALEIWHGARNNMTGMGLGNLGRAAARAGRLDEAAELYAESRHVCQRMGEAAMLLETDARDSERLMLAGESDAAIELASDVAERTMRLGGNPYVLTLTDRVIAYALAQRGEHRAAWDRLGRALMRSRETGAEYEGALTLQALGRVAALLGLSQAADFDDEAQATFAVLGVVRTPIVPLPEPDEADDPRVAFAACTSRSS